MLRQYDDSGEEFQSTLPRGERPVLKFYTLFSDCFNPRSHVGSDTSRPAPSATGSSFNPRSHVGSDSLRFSFISPFNVSIHAPTWGATPIPEGLMLPRLFQSTLPRGERPRQLEGRDVRKGFNPRSHVGSDRMTECLLVDTAVSIHAPTWGATVDGWHDRKLRQCFNPRSHVGSDPVGYLFRDSEDVSIHAPTWGATLDEHRGDVPSGVSIHAPTWGATLRQMRRAVVARFQSTLPRGERRSAAAKNVIYCGFNPRSHVGSDYM